MKNGDYVLVIAPDNYPGKKYRGRYCFEHHLVYWQEHGITPGDGEVIHHKNGNKRDNSIENLKLESKIEHNRNHTLSRGKTYVRLKCPNCGKIFIREKKQTHLVKQTHYTCCNRHCSKQFQHKFCILSASEQQFIKESSCIEEFKLFNGSKSMAP